LSDIVVKTIHILCMKLYQVYLFKCWR